MYYKVHTGIIPTGYNPLNQTPSEGKIPKGLNPTKFLRQSFESKKALTGSVQVLPMGIEVCPYPSHAGRVPVPAGKIDILSVIHVLLVGNVADFGICNAQFNKAFIRNIKAEHHLLRQFLRCHHG
jgi:hypothetical protein